MPRRLSCSIALAATVLAGLALAIPTADAAVARPVPKSPTAVAVTANGPTQMTIRWQASPRTTWYRLYRNGSYYTTDIVTNQYVDTGLQPGTAYSYLVTACVAGPSCSAASNSAAGTTPSATATPVAGTAPVASACSGIAVNPASALQTAINANPVGTTFCFAAGTYHLASTSQAALVPRSGDVLDGSAGATLEGDNKAVQAIAGSSTYQADITVEGFVIRDFVGSTSPALAAAVATGDGWNVHDNQIAYNRIGISVNSGDQILHNQLHDNTQYGLNGDGAAITISGNEIAHNNTDHNSNWDAGGMKICCRDSHDITLSYNNVHDNIGPAMWCDGCGAGIVFDHNSVIDNTDVGIDMEITLGGTISNNIVTDNASTFVAQSCFWGAGISVNTTPNVEIFGNTVTATNGSNGICAVDSDRTDQGGPLTNLYVHDNTMKVRSAGTDGVVGLARAFVTGAHNRFSNNVYDVSTVNGSYWTWNSGSIAWTSWRSAGMDPTGTLTTW